MSRAPMKGEKQRFFIAIGFYRSLAIMVGISIFSSTSTQILSHDDQLFIRSPKVNEVLNELRESVSQAGSGERGYILAGTRYSSCHMATRKVQSL